MVKTALLSLLATGLVAAAVVVAPTISVAQEGTPATQTFVIDTVHSGITFQVMHFGMTFVHGRFNEFEGKILWNEADMSQSAVHVDVVSSSIDTNNAGRDRHLRSADFFDVENNPTISFRSTSIEHAGDNNFAMTGELTLNGITKTIDVPVTKTGHGVDPRGGQRIGGIAEINIRRSDFGMTYGIDNGSIGDDVRLLLSFQGVLQN